MNIEKEIERENRDFMIQQLCGKWCPNCDKWETMKEKRTECEVLKARRRIINRMIRREKKLRGIEG